MRDHNLPGGTSDAVHDCYVNMTDPVVANSFEMQQFDRENFDSKLMAECGGKTTCNISYQFYEFARLPPSRQWLNMVLFAQVACTQSDEMIVSKNVWGLASACIGLFMCLMFMLTLQYVYNTDKINEKILDMALVTVDDYTAQTRLPK